MKLPIIATATLGIVVIIMQPIIEPLIPASLLPILIQLAKGYYVAGGLVLGGAIGAYMSERNAPPEEPKRAMSQQKGAPDPILADLKQSLMKPEQPKAVEFDLDKEYKLAMIKLAANGAPKPEPTPPTYEELLKEHNERQVK